MKLKKLILVGFKSFADRTEFEFDDGISCVVGPNGCGKSNIVDAIKWVLGEQSAKSLRGSEMADVIFNGSTARRTAGSAEVTLVFDNSSGTLQPTLKGEALEGSTVSITRRLYRSGHSEYLINKLPARLKDIREMFMDTGVGRDAYSLIEQGRVESFLQASHDDRRAIFDEAAGISRYKARKTEAARKLERVEQNLLRLNDIVAEVEKRLRSVKLQAGKARNYQEYTQRLRELRSLYLLAQYHQLSAQRTAAAAQRDQWADKLASLDAKIDQHEAARSAAEVEVVDLERSAATVQKELAEVQAAILAGDQRVEMLAKRIEETGEQVVAASSRCEGLEAKIDTAQRSAGDRNRDAEQIAAEAAGLNANYAQARQEYDAGDRSIRELAAALEDEKAGTIDLLRRTAQLHNEIRSQTDRQEHLHGRRKRLSERADQIAQSIQQLLTERAQVRTRQDDIAQLLSDTQTRLDDTRAQRDATAGSAATLQAELAEHRERRSALSSRIDTLQEMIARLDGVAAGARQVLEAQRNGRFPAIRGMVGQLVSTDVAHAAVVEAALSGYEQALVVDTRSAASAVAAEAGQLFKDRTGLDLLCLDSLAPYSSDVAAASLPGVLGRAIDYVAFEAVLAPAIWRLLGSTFVVADLPGAFAAAAAAPHLRFVTAAGDVVEPDGRARLAAGKTAAGVITRRSELAELSARRDELNAAIDDLTARHEQVAGEQKHLEALIQSLRTAIYETNTERVAAEGRAGQLDSQIEQLSKEQPLVAGDLDTLAAEIEQAVRAEHEAKEKAADLERRNVERQAQIQMLTGDVEAARAAQVTLTERMTELKVALASAEQRRLAVERQAQELLAQARQMEQELAAGRAEIESLRHRRSQAEADVAAARDELEALAAKCDDLSTRADDIEESRRGLAERLNEVRTALTELRRQKEQASSSAQTAQVELSGVDVRIENLISRAADELSMDLPALAASYAHDEQRDWAAVEAEIDELRGKIERLGNVNLDAITEQEELEKRREFLAAQLEDVSSSQRQLTELIRRINTESRQRFVETFEAIRTHFQELFRKLFGGGRADILLSDPEDVLESGIEIVARPPGKDTKTLSLLSGGEKTMTALALMFAIFRSKPSPFCLLDEVDAALDEANNQRFNHLVGEFVGESQFLIISHAKRTMSMAKVLYGVTMAEPGVSTRVSVRFEDVPAASASAAEEVSASSN